MPRPAVLRIARIPNEEGVYPLYFDAGGDELTDTFHATVVTLYSDVPCRSRPGSVGGPRLQ